MVTMYRAAQIAGVNKSSILKLSKKRPVPVFFQRQPDGTYLVDEGNRYFKKYVEHVAKKKGQKIPNRFEKLIDAVVDSIDEILDLPDEKRQLLLDTIDRKFNESL